MKTEIEKGKNYLVIYNDNWADEMDINGFFTCDGEYLLDVKKKLFSYKDEMEIGIGSNEDITFDNGKDLWKRLEIKEISDLELTVLNKLFSEETEENDKDIFDNHIYKLTESAIGKFPQKNPTEDWKDYSKRLEEWTTLRNNTQKKFKKENKNKFDEIVIQEKLEMDKEEEEQLIIQGLNLEGFEFDTNEDIDMKIQSLSEAEKESLIAKSKMMNKDGHITFGFADIIDQFIERIDEQEEE
jgi:hypothetical protein